MRVALWLLAAAACAAQQPGDWALPNFAQRLEFEVSNPSSSAVDTLALLPVAQAAQVAPRFPGKLAIAVIPGRPAAILPSQADDLDGDGTPDEFVFEVSLAAGESKTVHVYYSTTLEDSIPWPKTVHASHAYGYNHATAALESEVIGYRTYGGFFLDIQARRTGLAGLHNSLVGYFGSRNVDILGRDIIHLGNTLGLGGLFLRAGDRSWRPPLNMPDYAHKPEPPQAPHYRVVSSGPVRAMIEARIEHWDFGPGEVDIRALYSIAAGAGSVLCRFELIPRRLSETYEVGAGIRRLPQTKIDHARGRLALSGTQTADIGPLALALYYDPSTASPAPPLATKDDLNECVVFAQKLEPGRAVTGAYHVAGAWSGSGITDLLQYLRAEEPRARAGVVIGKFRFARTPQPERVEGEAP
jgi:hypothetical protein